MENLKNWLREFWSLYGQRLISRVKAFLWTGACIGVLAWVDWAGKNLEVFNLPEYAVAGFGLVLAQITKWLNDNKRKYGNKNK